MVYNGEVKAEEKHARYQLQFDFSETLACAFRFSSTPSNIFKAPLDIIIAFRTTRVERPRITIDFWIKVYVTERIQYVSPSRHFSIPDIHIRSYIPPHCNVRLCKAKGFANEAVEDGCLRFPDRYGNYGEVGGE